MTAAQQAAQATPYGVWPSPITAADVARNEALVEWVTFVGDEVWWIEAKPDENGRSALVRAGAGGTTEALPPGWDVRTRVIEYGARPWAPLGDGPTAGVVFTHWADQRVYRWAPGAEPVPISPEPLLPAGEHYCDFAVRETEVWCLRETRTGPEETAVRREIVALPLSGAAAGDAGAVRILGRSHHFMTGPKISPDGRRVAWVGWDHPDMPWQSSELMCAEVTPDGDVGTPRRLAGGGRVSVGQVEWAPDEPDCLYAVTDPGGWWNIHRVALDGTLDNLCARSEEFGEPLWRIGARWFLPLGGRRFAVLHGTSSRELAVLEPDGTLTAVPSPYTEWANLATDGTVVAAAAASPRHRRTVVLTDLATGAVRVLRAAETSHPDHLPRPVREVYPGAGGREVHAYRYPPHNPDVTAPAGKLPPYVLLVHGGPTNRSQMVVNYEIAFFTSRGIGIVDVQYGGSTGHGREYRERLDGNWGVVDVEDCAAVARGLVAAGIADPARIAIRGGSAGGWTAVASIAAEPDLYRAAAVYYPVLDAVEWRRRGTHDFESQYLDSLIGPWPAAEEAYVAQAPITRADRIRADFVLCQGLSDAICPPAQAQRLVDIARERGVGHRYLTFDGEGHGFRRTTTVTRCLEAELELYIRVFGSETGGPSACPPVGSTTA